MFDALQATKNWLEQAVIGLNLCPFAKAVNTKGLIHFAVSDGVEVFDIQKALELEIVDLMARPIDQRETTLLILSQGLTEFWEFDWFVSEADRLIEQLGLSGVIQIAAFHPEYIFGDEPPGDVTHCTNQSPFPVLHILREASVAQAVIAFPDADNIYERNKMLLRQMGHSGWQLLARSFKPDA
jgi:uncharacterized protein